MKSSNQNGFTHVAIAAAVVVLAAIGGVGYFVSSKNDSKDTQNSSSTSPSTSSASKETADQKAVKAAANAHFALVYQKKTQEAYSATCQEFKDLTSYDKFSANLDKGGFYTVDLSAIEYTSVDVRNNQAKISGPIGPLQPGTDLDVTLLKKDGKWCVLGYEAK